MYNVITSIVRPVEMVFIIKIVIHSHFYEELYVVHDEITKKIDTCPPAYMVKAGLDKILKKRNRIRILQLWILRTKGFELRITDEYP